jgi:hypothetical protein
MEKERELIEQRGGGSESVDWVARRPPYYQVFPDLVRLGGTIPSEESSKPCIEDERLSFLSMFS